MKRISSIGPEVQSHVWVIHIGPGVSLLTVNKVRELHRVLNEKDRGVVADHVVVALLSVELDGETSGISHCVSRAILTSNSGESQEQRGLLPN